MTTRLVVVGIEATSTHCNNSCPFMLISKSGDSFVAHCQLFDTKKLAWDKRKKEHGYKRPAACRSAEDAAHER